MEVYMIVVTAKMKVKSGLKDEFIGKAQDLITNTRAEDGCLSYSLYSDTDDPNNLVMLEFWKDLESLDLHMESEHFIRFGKVLNDYLASEIGIEKFHVDNI